MKIFKVGLLSLFLFAQVSLAKEIGIVMLVRGKAERIDSKKSETIKVGTKIYESDRIETAEEAYVKLVMNDRNILVVTEKSKLTINEYKSSMKLKKVLISLEQGSLRHALEQHYKKKNDRYEVKTATSGSGVRGTDFITQYEPQTGDTVLCTLRGQVSFDLIKDGKPAETPVLASAGEFIR
ncbi:MAG: FecR domain-containing protein, partial [Pseudobdellovibrio sp.]